jgi:tRNA (cmo5U34)-methyltransferase
VSEVEVSFDQAARDYDRARRQLVPCFDDFYGAVLEFLTFGRDEPVRFLDLGAGTGLLSALIGEAFPNARITLVDFSGEMLEKARQRFAPGGAASDRFELRVGDFAREHLSDEYDAIVSALAIHHLENESKKALFRGIHGVLSEGGVFVNADQVLGATPEIEERYQEWWLREAREKGVSETDLAASRERIEADKNATLESQLAWLEEAGFEAVDCPYKNRRFAVYGGRKPRGAVASKDGEANGAG